MNTKENIVKISDAKPARVKSKETSLKQELRGLKKELLSIDKMVVDHEAMAKKVADARALAATIKDKIGNAKQLLIKELGLE